MFQAKLIRNKQYLEITRKLIALMQLIFQYFKNE